MNRTIHHCPDCKRDLSITRDNFTPSAIKILTTKNTIHLKCRDCINEYTYKRNQAIKNKNQTRSRKDKDELLKVQGKIYIIGVKGGKNTPYKIGLVTGTTIQKRLVSLQTSHWIELEIVYESPVLDHIRIHESNLHKKYSERKVRGEWYKLTKKMIQEIKEQYD